MAQKCLNLAAIRCYAIHAYIEENPIAQNTCKQEKLPHKISKQ